jgi:hypothetical protein
MKTTAAFVVAFTLGILIGIVSTPAVAGICFPVC